MSDLIWHFTDRDTLYPILRDGILGTHQAFMNDTSDCLLSRRVATALSKIFDASLEVPEKDLPTKYVEMKNGLYAGTCHAIFLTCLSETVENPLLWRCYTSQGGFAIGVSEEDLRQSLGGYTDQLYAVRFKRCSYEDWTQAICEVEDLERVFDRRCVRLKDPLCDPKEKATIIIDSIKESLKMEKSLVFRKDPFFEGEHEVRVMYTFNDSVPLEDLVVLAGKPRIRIPLLKPFSSLVQQIKVSPFGDAVANFNLARILAASIGLPLSRVEMFEAPIR
jgi:hypothetical protein